MDTHKTHEEIIRDALDSSERTMRVQQAATFRSWGLR